MKRYLEHIRSKDPHDRRQHAMHVSSGLLAIVFLVWITTIGWRFTMPGQGSTDSSGQLANVLNAANAPATLIVATTTDNSY